jgi:alpha-L-fucosidase
VGNEGGVGRTTEWSVIPLPLAPEQCRWPDLSVRDLGSRAKLKPGSYLWWYPAEVNVTILDRGAWFWARGKHPRSLSQLFDIFFTSVGRNGNLILNLSPDSRGRVPDDQLEALNRLSQLVNDTFAVNLAGGGKLTADNANPAHKPARALDHNLDTWWEAAPGHTNADLTLTLPKPVTFDVVSLQEAVDHRGQRIESFAIDVGNGADWAAAGIISSDQTTTVGHHRLIRLKSPVTTSRVRLRITGSRCEPTLAEIGLYQQSVAAWPPVISGRDASGLITLGNSGGTAPTTNSPVYQAPFAPPPGATVQAACVLASGQLGSVAAKSFAGPPPAGWKVVAVDSEETAGADNAAARALDGDASTFWHTRWNEDLTLPHFLTVDMGRPHRIAGCTYLPRQDGNPRGIVDTFRFETSEDGANWTTNIVSGTFANIQNNPSLQEVPFAPVSARYFRFTALREVNGGGWTSAAEISVVPAGGSGD